MRTIFGLCLSLCSVALLAGQSTPTFRSGTRLIVEPVTVKDKDGKPVEGLTARDFALTEDGEPQTISFVEFQRVDDGSAPPAGAAGAGAPQSAAIPNAGPFSERPPEISASRAGEIRYRNRRLLVLYFDVTALPPPDLLRACRAARTFIDTQMTATDMVAMMSFKGGGVRVNHDFTDNRAELDAAIQDLIYGEDKDGDGIPDPEPGTAFGQDDSEFNIFNTDRQLSAIQTAMSMLRSVTEQKSLVYFASGLRLNGTDNQAQLRATVNAAVRANVAIHTIDARGLIAQPPLGDATQPSPAGNAVSLFNGSAAESQATFFQRSQDSLYALAKDTGGQALFDYNDLSLGIVRAAQALGSYYLIGYYSTHSEGDGKFHRVRVSLTGGAAASLSYRQGYFADKSYAKFTAADKERQLEDALLQDDPITDITMAMEVNFFQLNRAEYFVPVSVKIPGSEVALASRGGAQRTLIDFIGEVKDDYGYTIQNLRDKLDITLSDSTAAQLATRPIQYETGFTLLPGKYVLKLLARDEETGRIGTYQAAFTVPNLEREVRRVPISSVVLGSQRVSARDALYSVRQKLQAEAVNPLVSGGLKLAPSVTRVFSRSRELYVLLQAYEHGATPPQPLVGFVSLYRGGVKSLGTEPLAVTAEPQGRAGAMTLRFTVPLENLPTGRYDCQVTVLNPSAAKAAFWRAPIVIVP